MKNRQAVLLIIVLFFLMSSISLCADDLDGQLIFSGRLAGSTENWRFTGDYEIRLDQDLRALDYHLFEAVASYMPNRNWEIVPDFRISMFPDRFEFRPGFGILNKITWGKKIFIRQIVNQVKWQLDITNDGVLKNGLRYGLFYNHVMNKKLMFNSGVGIFYRWSDSYTGFQFIRFVAGLSVNFDSTHAVTFSPFFGLEDPFKDISYTLGLMIIFSMRLKDNSKYLPATYISF